MGVNAEPHKKRVIIERSRKIIERPRLQSRLSFATQYRISAIVAPAGFGKSIALKQFVTTNDSWILYNVPQGTDSLLRFARDFCRALWPDIPNICAEFGTTLSKSQNLPSAGTDLACRLAPHVSSLSKNIAIDNLDCCIVNSSISNFIDSLQRESHQSVKWLFGTRGLTSLPGASWLAYGQSDLFVDSADLRFTISEARASWNAAADHLANSDCFSASCVDPTDQELSEIFALSDGWPVGLSFAIRVYLKTRSLRSLADDTRALVNQYFAENSWNSLDADSRSFLSTAAHLPRITLDSIAQAGFAEPRTVMKSLQSQVGMFPRPDGGYELHGPFRAFVESETLAEGSDKLAEARIKAGAVLEGLHLYPDALELYVQAHPIADSERVLTRLNFGLLESGAEQTVEGALRLLRGRKSPSALALRAAIEESRGRVSSAEALYARALASAPLSNSLRVGIAWRYSLLLLQQGRTDLIPLLEELSSSNDLDESERAQIIGSLAVLIAFTGDVLRAQSLILEAIELTEDSDDQLRARTLGRASTVAFFAGDNSNVERYAKDAAQIAEECSLFALSARIKTSLSALYVSSGRLKLACEYASQVVQDAEKAQDHELRVRGLREQLMLEAEMGNEARFTAIEAALSACDYDGPTAFIGLLVAQGMRFIWHSRFGDAIRLFSEGFPNELSWHQHLLRTSLLAVTASAERRVSIVHAAVQTYEDFSALNSENDPMFVRERTLTLQYVSLALLLTGERSRSRLYAERAATMSPDHCTLDETIKALNARSTGAFKDALRDLEARYQGGIARLVDAVSRSLFGRELGGNLRLTVSEFSVLRAMSAGLSNKAIADLHGTKLNTVRCQVSAVLRKLDSDSRGEAVATARHRRLI